jgi:hypothetical protein
MINQSEILSCNISMGMWEHEKLGEVLRKEIFPWGTWEHIKLGEIPQHNALGFFC